MLEQYEWIHRAIPFRQDVLIVQDLHVVVLSNKMRASNGTKDLVDDLFKGNLPILQDVGELIVSEGNQRVHQFPHIVSAIAPQGGAVEKFIEVFESVWSDQILQVFPVLQAVVLDLALDDVVAPVNKLSRRHAVLATIIADDNVVGRKATVIGRPAASRIGRRIEIESHGWFDGLDAVLAKDIGPSGHTQITTLLPNWARILHNEIACNGGPVGHLYRAASRCVGRCRGKGRDER